MRLTQGAFSFLPDLSDDQIIAQLDYCLKSGWAISVEFTDDPHPRNVYWEMWAAPMFDLKDAAGAMQEVKACRQAHPDGYVKVVAFDARRGWETVRLSFIVNRPRVEPGLSARTCRGLGTIASIHDNPSRGGNAGRRRILRRSQT